MKLDNSVLRGSVEIILLQVKGLKKPCSTAYACLAEKKNATVFTSLLNPDVSFSVLHCLVRKRECQKQANKRAHKPAHE